jgi:predicted nucleic acid-binding protein
MLRSRDTIVVDTDAMIGLFNPNDALASDASALLKSIVAAQATLVYPSTTIVETVTTFQRKLNDKAAAAQIVQGIRAKDFIIEMVDQSVIDTASALFNPQGSKQNTFFDAIVAAVAQKLNATAVFSFDGWYEKVGLRLVASVI